MTKEEKTRGPSIQEQTEESGEETGAAAGRADAPGSGEIPAPEVERSAEPEPEPGRELEELCKRLAELEDSFMRAKAESENVEKRAREQIDSARKYAAISFARSMLDVRDAIAAALANRDAGKDSLIQGIELTLKKVDSEFEKQMICEIKALGQRFDPELHDAMGTREHGSLEPNTVCEVLVSGFTIGDRVLRAAAVIVTKAQEAGGADGTQDEKPKTEGSEKQDEQKADAPDGRMEQD